MAARPQFDPDSAYITHPHSGALAYEPLPIATLRSLHIIRTLQTHTTDADELAWLEAREAMLTGECVDCPPVTVRNVEPRRWTRPFPKHETKYALRSQGPTNKSGRARS
jgi:hypothetical protein